MRFVIAVAIAVSFWHARGVEIPCHPVPVVNADALLPKGEWGWPADMGATSGCRILLSNGGSVSRVAAPDRYCTEIVHEVGHLAGLPHTEHGVMSPVIEDDSDIPYDCKHWQAAARRLGFKPHRTVRVRGS